MLNLNAHFLRALNRCWPLVTLFNRESSRRLTGGEIAMAQGVFEDQIDYDKVRIHAVKGWLGDIAPAFVCANHINVSLSQVGRVDDFSLLIGSLENESYGTSLFMRGNAFKLSVFFHELTHIYQLQTQNIDEYLHKRSDELAREADGEDVYFYKLKDNTPFDEMGLERQAQLIGDFAKLRHTIANMTPVGSMNDKGYEARRQRKLEKLELMRQKIGPIFPAVLPS